MINRKKGRKGVFYRKSLVWLLLTASVPGFITGICIYLFGVGQIEKDLSALHRNQMEERVQYIDDQLSYLELDLSHWAFSPRFGQELQELDFVYYFQDTYDISKSLVVLEGSHPLIQEVGLFIDRANPILFKTGYYLLDDPGTTSAYRKLLADPRYVYWVEQLKAADVDSGHTPADDPTADTAIDQAIDHEEAREDEPIKPPDNSNRTRDPIALVHKIPGGSTSPFGVLVVTLQREKVVNLLKTMTPYNEGATFLMDRDGGVIVSDEREGQAFQDQLKQIVQSRGDESGSFLWDYERMTYSVSYGKLKRIDSEWTYVSASPMNAITSPVVVLSNIILIISASGLLFALVLSWFASLRMYSPVERLIRHFSNDTNLSERGIDEFQFIEKQWHHAASESLELQSRLKDQLPKLRSGFLLQLLQGHLYAYSEEDLRERMQRYGWKIDNHQFHMLHIRLTGSDNLSERFSQKDESLVTFAASNITEELAAERFEQFNVMNFHDLSVGLFIITANDQPIAYQLQSLGEQITTVINQILKLQVTITISRPTNQIKRISETFMEVERAAGFRQFVNRNQILSMDDLSVDEANPETKYPFALELDIIQSMRSGKQEAAEELVARFIEEALTCYGTEYQVQQSMLQLLGSMQHMMLQSGVNPFKLFQGENRFERLSQIRDPDKMLRWMKEQVIIPFMHEREARANIQLKQMIDQSIEYIHANYRNNLSLESCADLVGTNSYTLSKLFKQITGVNFIDYVTELRIAKAKELLSGSDMKINDVAEEVGYQQRYFNRIFKKQVGITPSEYRDSAG
ncbi:AraC family transcriptional regulator [Paenibacillus tarimensis]